MATPISINQYLHLVNAGKNPLDGFKPGVYQLNDSFVAYRKNKTQATLSPLRKTENEAIADLEEYLPELEKTEFNPFASNFYDKK